MDESDPIEALEQFEFDQQQWREAMETIKREESWAPNAFPSMKERWLFAALKRRAETAEAQVSRLTDALHKLPSRSYDGREYVLKSDLMRLFDQEP